MATAQPESSNHEEDGSIATEEATYFSDGHPTVMPVKPALTTSNTRISERNRSKNQESTMIAQPHPHDRAAAIVYSPEELASMGFARLTVPHSLVNFEHGSAELIPERRDPKRVTVETSEKLGLVLDPKEKRPQETKEFEGAKARLERHLDELAASIKEAYTKQMTERFPQPKEISTRTLEVAKNNLIETLKTEEQRDITGEITKESLRPLLETAGRNARQTEINKFNKDDNFAWEDILNTIISNSPKRYFTCTVDMIDPLLKANISPRIIQLDDNPKHTATISTASESSTISTSTKGAMIDPGILHSSGESFAIRHSKRNPPTPRATGMGHNPRR